jgi:hypothetical protein
MISTLLLLASAFVYPMDASAVNLSDCDGRADLVRLSRNLQSNQMADNGLRPSCHGPEVGVPSRFPVGLFMIAKQERLTITTIWLAGTFPTRDAYLNVSASTLSWSEFPQPQANRASVARENCDLDSVRVRLREGTCSYRRGIQNEGQRLADVSFGLGNPGFKIGSGPQIFNQNGSKVENSTSSGSVSRSYSSLGPQDVVGDFSDFTSRASWFYIPLPLFRIGSDHGRRWRPQNNNSSGEAVGGYQCREKQKRYLFFHRALAAFPAIWERFRGLRLAALAEPPIEAAQPPQRDGMWILGRVNCWRGLFVWVVLGNLAGSFLNDSIRELVRIAGTCFA